MPLDPAQVMHVIERAPREYWGVCWERIVRYAPKYDPERSSPETWAAVHCSGAILDEKRKSGGDWRNADVQGGRGNRIRRHARISDVQLDRFFVGADAAIHDEPESVGQAENDTERTLFQLIGRGVTSREIAKTLQVSPARVSQLLATIRDGGVARTRHDVANPPGAVCRVPDTFRWQDWMTEVTRLPREAWGLAWIGLKEFSEHYDAERLRRTVDDTFDPVKFARHVIFLYLRGRVKDWNLEGFWEHLQAKVRRKNKRWRSPKPLSDELAAMLSARVEEDRDTIYRVYMRTRVSREEQQMIRLALQGLNQTQIAETLGVSRWYVRRVMVDVRESFQEWQAKFGDRYR